jgi:hypothetical protein
LTAQPHIAKVDNELGLVEMYIIISTVIFPILFYISIENSQKRYVNGESPANTMLLEHSLKVIV